MNRRDEKEISWGRQILEDPSAFAKMDTSHCKEGHHPYDRVILPKQLNLIDSKDPISWLVKSFLPHVDSKNLFFIDVGANAGQFVIPIRKHGHEVISFEPVPSTCKKLKDNLAKEGLTSTVYCKAVSDKVSTVQFVTDGGADTSFHQAFHKDHGRQNVSISTTTIDLTIPKNKTTLLLKTDTQGYELQVLKGASQLLDSGKVKFIAVEFSYGLLTAAGTNPLDILNFLAARNYICAHFGFHTMIKKGIFGEPNNMPKIEGTSISFEHLVELVHNVPEEWGGIGKSGWTDLLCWQSCWE